MLKNYKIEKCKLRNLSIKKEEIEEDIGGLKAIDYSKESINCNNVSSSVENEVLLKEKILKDINIDIKRIERNLNMIDDALENVLNFNEREVIKRIYIEEKRNFDVSSDLGYCDSTVIKFKKMAIKKLIKVLIN